MKKSCPSFLNSFFHGRNLLFHLGLAFSSVRRVSWRHDIHTNLCLATVNPPMQTIRIPSVGWLLNACVIPISANANPPYAAPRIMTGAFVLGGNVTPLRKLFKIYIWMAIVGWVGVTELVATCTLQQSTHQYKPLAFHPREPG